MTPEEVGQRIRTRRLELRWTNEELARRVGVNWRTVQRWQHGQLPRLPRLLHLAEVLGVPQSHLVYADDPPVTIAALHARVEELATRVERLALSVRALERVSDPSPARTVRAVASQQKT